MSLLKEKNKIVREERTEEDLRLREFFAAYDDCDYINYRYDTFRYNDSPRDYNDPKERRTLVREVGCSDLCTYDFFDLADKLKKVAAKLKRKGYTAVDVVFESEWDSYSLVMYIKRKETDAEVDARLEAAKQNKKNAKMKKDKELEKLEKLAAKKGLKLVKEEK